jgi:hypothetical protein
VKRIPFLIIGLVGVGMICCFGGVGAACSLGFSPLFSDRAAKIADMPTTTDVRVGEQAALTGVLSNNAIITSDPDMGDITAYEMVAYKVETYDRRTTGSGSRRRTTGSWTTTRTAVNTLTMDVDGHLVTFSGEDAVKLTGDLHNFQEDETLQDGSQRVSGFRNGDQVTIVAERQESGAFLADELYGGTRDELVSDTRTAAAIFRYGGYGLMVCGGGIGLVLLIGSVALALRKR